MLSEKSRPIIEATLPVVGSRIGEITPKFYDRLFAGHPELLDGVFSRSNQRDGSQQQALAGSIAAFATHLIEHPGELPEAVLSRIAHKHGSLGVTEAQYQIVYDHLFAAIADDLGEAATPEVVEAWTEVYWLMADALIRIERGLYARQANDQVWSLWRVVAKEPAGKASMTFRLRPADDTVASEARPGQFVSVRVRLGDGLRQCRQYTLSQRAADASERVFTSKLDEDGEVSPFLHRVLTVGDTVELSNPYGDVMLEESDAPLVIATAGIGCTQAAAVLDALATAGSTRRVLVLHADRSEAAWALREQMLDSVAALPNAELRLWFEDVSAPDEKTRAGTMDLAGIDLPEGATMLLCGPLPFMRAIRSQAVGRGIAPRDIAYEVFGPDLWITERSVPET